MSPTSSKSSRKLLIFKLFSILETFLMFYIGIGLLRLEQEKDNVVCFMIWHMFDLNASKIMILVFIMLALIFLPNLCWNYGWKLVVLKNNELENKVYYLSC